MTSPLSSIIIVLALLNIIPCLMLIVRGARERPYALGRRQRIVTTILLVLFFNMLGVALLSLAPNILFLVRRPGFTMILAGIRTVWFLLNNLAVAVVFLVVPGMPNNNK